MSQQTQARQRDIDHLNVLFGEPEGAQRYRERQRQARSGRMVTAPRRPRPLEFDESGFPVVKRNSSFVSLVGRLLKRF